MRALEIGDELQLELDTFNLNKGADMATLKFKKAEYKEVKYLVTRQTMG